METDEGDPSATFGMTRETAGWITAVWDSASKDTTIPGRAQCSEERISCFNA